jgi:hypothetical protein
MTPARSASLAKLAAELAEPEPVAQELELVVPELVARVVPVAELVAPAVVGAADSDRT